MRLTSDKLLGDATSDVKSWLVVISVKISISGVIGTAAPISVWLLQAEWSIPCIRWSINVIILSFMVIHSIYVMWHSLEEEAGLSQDSIVIIHVFYCAIILGKIHRKLSGFIHWNVGISIETKVSNMTSSFFNSFLVQFKCIAIRKVQNFCSLQHCRCWQCPIF